MPRIIDTATIDRSKLKKASCHPDRTLHARGLCHSCWVKDKFGNDLDKYRKHNCEKARSYRKRMREANNLWHSRPHVKAKARDRWLRSKYKISEDEWNKMFEAQEGKCAICRLVPTGIRKHLVVDHNHKTGKIRGLLCIPCNSHIIGRFDKDPDMIQRVLNYITVEV